MITLENLELLREVLDDALTMQADPEELVRALDIINEAALEMINGDIENGNEEASADGSAPVCDAPETPEDGMAEVSTDSE